MAADLPMTDRSPQRWAAFSETSDPGGSTVPMLRRTLQIALALLVVIGGAVVVPSAAQAGPAGCSVTPSPGGQRGYHICAYPPSIITWPDGHRQYFVTGTDWQVYSNHQTGSTWSGWYPLGGVSRSEVWATQLTSTSIDIHVIGTNGVAHVKKWRASSGWQGWASEGYTPTASVSCGNASGSRIFPYERTTVIWPDGRVQCLVVGTDRRVYESHEYSPGGDIFTPWASLGGTGYSKVGYIPPTDGQHLAIAVIGNNGSLYSLTWTLHTGGGQWYPTPDDVFDW